MIDKSKYSSQMKETFGEYIRTLRISNNLTLTQLAAKLDMDSANLSKIETGKREFDFKRLSKLSQTFHLDIKVLTEEYLSEKFAKTIIETKTNSKVLQLAEQKVEYLTQKNSKQGSLKF
ncbi:MAG: helix-turn-helix domain-containing protein [Candidatus Heimdallarchaeota archaeon]